MHDETWNGPTRDEVIGQNLSRVRGTRSQQSVAKAMQSRGHKWSQSTMWSVEQGKRPLRLTEAESLAEVLGCEIEDLMARGAFESIESLGHAVTAALDDLFAAAYAYEARLFELALTADLVIEAGEREIISLPVDPESKPEDWIRLNLNPPYDSPPANPGPNVAEFIRARRSRYEEPRVEQ